MRESIVIKLSGHLLFSELDYENIKKYADVVKNIFNEGYRVSVIVGGGKKAREYINVAMKFGINNFERDIIGITLTHVNASLLSYAIGDLAFKPIPKTLSELIESFKYLDEKILVLGGLIPGQSTIAVAALVAEAIKAKLIIYATTVDGIYTADPKIHPNAKLIKQINVKELIKLMCEMKAEAGTYKLFDMVALKIIERSKIPVRVINGYNVDNIVKAVHGEDIGSLVIY